MKNRMSTLCVLQGFYFQLVWTNFWSMPFGLISSERNQFQALRGYSIMWIKAQKVKTLFKNNTLLIYAVEERTGEVRTLRIRGALDPTSQWRQRQNGLRDLQLCISSSQDIQSQLQFKDAKEKDGGGRWVLRVKVSSIMLFNDY